MDPKHLHPSRRAKYVCHFKGTEVPLVANSTNIKWGRRVCVACSQDLFPRRPNSTPEPAGPAFTMSLTQGKVESVLDESHGMSAREVVCNNCKAHLATFSLTAQNPLASAMHQLPGPRLQSQKGALEKHICRKSPASLRDPSLLDLMFPCSSVVEQPAVNRWVVGSESTGEPFRFSNQNRL